MNICIEFYKFRTVCGYFTHLTYSHGNGCKHPEQEECDDCYVDKDGYQRMADETNPPTHKQGRCYSCYCPLATECDLEALKEDPDYFGEPINPPVGGFEKNRDYLIIEEWSEGYEMAKQLLGLQQ